MIKIERGGVDMKIDYKKIENRIAARRRELGMKQAEVEEKAGIGYKYLSNIERGISVPSLDVILKPLLFWKRRRTLF